MDKLHRVESIELEREGERVESICTYLRHEVREVPRQVAPPIISPSPAIPRAHANHQYIANSRACLRQVRRLESLFGKEFRESHWRRDR